MYGEFDEIIRFEMLHYEDGELDQKEIDENTTDFEHIVKTIKTYLENKRDIKVKIIGHTDEPTDDISELSIDSDTYANKIQNLFRYELDTKESEELSKEYAKDVKQKFIDNEIPKELLVVEYRAGKDMGFTDATTKGRDLSNRVKVTIYVLPSPDSDKDGVFDKNDKCPNTPLGIAVDENGCPLDSDKDGVYDLHDECPKTPLGVKVDKVGCPLDSDKDGVYDYLDKCPDTKQGLKVDVNGCPFSSNLAINFKTDSYEIINSYNEKIEEFATFLKENPAYKAEIIGHTDSVGSETNNLTLSKNRAKATKEALVAQGVEESRLSFDGKGESSPIATNKTKEGKQANRRIEVKLSLD